MAGPTIGYATLPVIPSMKGAQASLAKEGGLLGGVFGKALLGGIGLVVAGGVGLFKLGANFQDAFNTIRVGTGATGEALDSLKQDFREVFADVPASMDDVGTSIADLNTRLGLTGKPLQDLSTQILNLSRITDTDLGQNIEDVTRLFGDWSVSTDLQSSKLDALFRASQATGPSVGRISQLMVQYGAPLRQLGFNFEQSAALVGKFEKEGVNTQLVMGSLRVALGKMAREGEAPVETFRRMVSEIKNAGTAGQANALALELFGARAGPDMAAAIREGRFELGNLLDIVEGSPETINGAAAATETFSEKWDRFTNRMALAFEPAANAVITKAEELLDAFEQDGWRGVFVELFGEENVANFETGANIVQTKLQELGDWMREHVGDGEDFKRGWGILVDEVFDPLGGAAQDTWVGFTNVGDWMREHVGDAEDFRNGWGILVSEVFDPIGGSVQSTWEGFTNVGDWMREHVGDGEDFKRGWSILVDDVFDPIAGSIQWAWDKGVGFVGFLLGMPATLKSQLGEVWGFLSDGFDNTIGAIARTWNDLRIPEIGPFGPWGPIPRIGPFGPFDLPDIPGFDDGGTVPGPRGSAQLILAHGGETVLPTHKQPMATERPVQIEQNFYEAQDPYETADISSRLIASRVRPRGAWG